MDKGFFERIEEHKHAFAGRAAVEEGVGIELVLATGRTYEVGRVVDTQDGWVQIDGRDLADPEEEQISLVIPYFQINFVRFAKQRPRRRAGFAR